jgi:hypothetical protein
MKNTILIGLGLGLGLGLALGCGKTPSEPKPAPEPAPAQAPASAPAPASEPVVILPPLQQRPNGPSIKACEQAAAHLGELVIQATAPSGLTDKEMTYVTAMSHANREQIISLCLQTAAVKEIDCVLAAKTIADVGGCERFRREVPEDLAEHREVTDKDCARFFDRLRQFKIEEGADPAEIDKTRDQIIRACEEKAKPGTIACFIASPDYAHARLCP